MGFFAINSISRIGFSFLFLRGLPSGFDITLWK
jgi:hypothetical protein